MIAQRMVEQAKTGTERDNSISAVIFCAFSLEGYLNHAGEELIPKWNELFESLKPRAKLALLADRYGVDIAFGESPFQSFGTIFEVRNQLAHPKTKKHDTQEKSGKVLLEIETTKWPAERWEVLCEKKYAEQFVKNTDEMIKLLDETLPLEKVPSFILSENL
jgi:hypothetical protein